MKKLQNDFWSFFISSQKIYKTLKTTKNYQNKIVPLPPNYRRSFK